LLEGKIRRRTTTMAAPQQAHFHGAFGVVDEAAGVFCMPPACLNPQLEHRYQPLAIGVQKAKVARAPKAFGQHMLQHQAQELRTGNGARGASLGLLSRQR